MNPEARLESGVEQNHRVILPSSIVLEASTSKSRPSCNVYGCSPQISFMQANMIVFQRDIIVPRAVSKHSTKDSVMLLVSVEYHIHKLQEQLLAFDVNDNSDAVAKVSDALLRKKL